MLQHRRENANAIVYYVFDVLAFRERDVRQLALRQRRELLDEVFQSAREPLRVSAILDAAPADLISAVKSQGLKGIIAKRVNSRYESKQRSGAWVKYRVNKGQELVIGGYRVGKNDFDNLAVGYYDDAGRLIFIAKIKNGFTPDMKRQVFRSTASSFNENVPVRQFARAKDSKAGRSAHG